MDKDNKQKKSHNSFYKEANKSILGQKQMTPKRIGKISFKLIKWSIFTFLIIATLWGCVNEFIIQTSNNLGQGVEFYQKDDFIYPNMYSAVEINGYTHANENGEIEAGIKDKNIVDTNEDGTEDVLLTDPFLINTINPNFGAEISEDLDQEKYNVEELQVDKILINSSEIKLAKLNSDNQVISFVDSPASYSYNLNYISTRGYGSSTLTGMFNYNWENFKIGNDLDYFVPLRTLPISIINLAEEETLNIPNADNQYEVTGVKDFLFYLKDKEDGTVDNQIFYSEELNDYFKFTDDYDYNDGIQNYEVLSTKIGLIPNNITTVNEALVFSNWSSVELLDISSDKDGLYSPEAINNQIKMDINKMAFINGTLKATYEDLPEEFKNEYYKQYPNVQYEAESYSVDFTSILGDGELGVDVFGGSQVFVVPIAKGFPIKASDSTKELIDGNETTEGFRSKGYRDSTLTPETSDYGFDSTTQMYGWMLLDGNNPDSNTGSDLLRTYSTKDFSDEGTEDKYFYADQRRLGWGTIPEDGQSNPQTSVFDEKIKNMMSSPDQNYIKMSTKTSIGGEMVTADYASTFAGMTTLEEITNFSETFTGTLPKLEKIDVESKAIERSILSDSVIPTGQDSWGENRVAFVGWSDWGKAWNVQYGPLYGAFVFPLAQLSMGIGEIFNYFNSPWGTLISIFVIVFLTRGLGALLSLKGTKNQMKMQGVQTEVAKIKSKYSKYDLKAEPKMKQKQQSEIMALYRKNEVNPMGSIGTIFVTMPIFISLWIIISSLPAYKLVIMGQFSWAVSAFYGIFNSGFGILLLYLLVGISVGLVQGVSSKLPTWLANKRKGVKRIDEGTKASMKKQNRTQNIMIGVFVFMGLTVPALFAFYWIASGFFTIWLELMRHSWRVHVSKQMKINSTYQSPIAKMTHFTKSKFIK